MKSLKKLAKRFVRDEEGLELSEYAIMAGIIIVLTVAIIVTIGGQLDTIFQSLSDALTDAGGAPAAG